MSNKDSVKIEIKKSIKVDPLIANAIKNQFSDTNIEDLITIVDRYKKADSWYKTTYINKKDYNRLLDIMIYGKTIDKKVNIDDLITNEYN